MLIFIILLVELSTKHQTRMMLTRQWEGFTEVDRQLISTRYSRVERTGSLCSG
ncbi:uncharacterized protein PHALS_13057 [Plasmopara halstedii]|uniref:RxLR-like protein n=1 Tax=Plasmopara halstedii TaxID=4781 RepID=A0A0P1ANN3_PLAHL|nr:uncharacterized protein PHALS_13057 [Plasmopara halstedii]CEG42812.1 hypothetical protein PHALS_13057 [Plasmopara halstedii]|eukprot:XP_024579181.1 hypothetical protein PHALS_13057 [Plasmopara halstedii]